MTNEEKNEYQRKYYRRNPTQKRNYHKNKDFLRSERLLIKEIVHRHYSKGLPKCACCGERQRAFLGIDHIEDGGRKHKKEIGGWMPGWLFKNNYPPGFQILCHNCNQAKHILGACPHESEDQIFGKVA